MNFPCYATSVIAGSFFPARWHTWLKHCIQQETVENQFYLSKYHFSDWFERRILKLLLVIQKLQNCPFNMKHSHLFADMFRDQKGRKMCTVSDISFLCMDVYTGSLPGKSHWLLNSSLRMILKCVEKHSEGNYLIKRQDVIAYVNAYCRLHKHW